MHPTLRAIYGAVRPARVFLAPEMWSRNDAFKSMVPPLAELLCVPLYDVPAGERAELAEFYSWIGSAAFIVFRVRSEAEWRLSKGASDQPTAEGDRLTHRVLARLFSEEGAKHLERTSIEDVQSDKSAVVAATCIGDAHALSRANMIDPAAVESLSDLTKAHAGAVALSAIDEGTIKQPREIQLFRGMHWAYTGQPFSKAYGSWLSASRMTKEIKRLGIPMPQKMRDFSKPPHR